MLQQQQVRIKPRPGGAEFINEKGEKSIKLGRSVMAEIGGILEMLADCGREAILLFEVETADEGYPLDEEPELCAVCEGEITAGQPVRQDDSRPGYYYRHSDCGLPVQ